MRGEYNTPGPTITSTTELPPRARRILYYSLHTHRISGTTSACAENTSYRNLFYTAYGNYLRVRGEYSKKILLTLTLLELPPRARRIRVTGMTTTTMMGTTSACAENTFWLTMFGGECWNYLRVRGEYWKTSQSHQQSAPARNYLRVRGEYWKPGWTHPRLPELPPRARRILTKFGSQRLSGGTTSACAENTVSNL